MITSDRRITGLTRHSIVGIMYLFQVRPSFDCNMCGVSLVDVQFCRWAFAPRPCSTTHSSQMQKLVSRYRI